jgi:hypothetical protein
MSEEYVIFNGVKVAAEWPAKIIEAQEKITYVINGEPRERIRYGDEAEDWGADDGPCHDCAVVKGQYHVPFLCDVERCPGCGEQAIGCDCDYEGDS